RSSSTNKSTRSTSPLRSASTFRSSPHPSLARHHSQESTMRPAFGFAVLLATGLLAAPLPARADGFISPTVGVNFGGQAGGTLRTSVNDGNKINWGVAAGWMGAGVIGVEEDFTHSPNFFGSGGNIDNSRV